MPTCRLILCVLFSVSSALIQSSPLSCLVDQGKPTPKLLGLLSALSIEHDGTLDSIVAATQKEQPEGFLRASGKERWELGSLYGDRAETIMQYMAQLGVSEGIYPERKSYEYALLLGGIIYRVRNRIGFLSDCWQRGIRWKKLVILTGVRPLDTTLESKEQLEGGTDSHLHKRKDWQLSSIPKTEAEMIAMVLEQSELPAEWKGVPVETIVAPLKADGVRPSTIDTMRAWLSKNPGPGSVLAVSNQPYVGYQEAVLRSQLPEEFSLEVVGREQQTDATPEMLLDTIGRSLYNIRKQEKS